MKTLLVRALLLAAWTAAAAESGPLPAPWKNQDVGAVELKGSASLKDSLFTLSGTLDTWGTNDGFHFVYQPWQGDGEIVARVLSVENTFNHAKGGLMFRQALTPGSPHAEIAVTAVDGAQFLVRGAADAKTTSAKTDLNKGKFPYWVKLVRAGKTFSGYESLDGKSWTLTGTTNLDFPPSLFVGLATSSHQKAKLCTATFDQVKLSRP